jgi:type III restriction enzyme
MVLPVFTIQVENKGGNTISTTDLDECLKIVEKELGRKLEQGEVVHSFGDPQNDIEINNLKVPYMEPSRIEDSEEVKIVFIAWYKDGRECLTVSIICVDM